MIAVDTNILIAAHRVDAEWHPAAASTVRSLAEGGAPWAIPWPCFHEFLAIVTHPRIFDPPTQPEIALETVAHWRASPSLVPIGEGDRYWETLVDLVRTGRVAGPRVHDARVGAICINHGVREPWSADRDFSRFPRLRVRNPLIAEPH